MKKLMKALLLAELLFSGSALAVTPDIYVDWGVHDAVEVSPGIHLPFTGSFFDVFAFTLPSATGLTSVAVANNNVPALNMTDGVVELYSGVFGDLAPDVFKSSYTFDGTTGDTSHSMGVLSSGSYYYTVSGKVSSPALGGAYLLSSAVPEPETWAMLMAGVGLIGLRLRRKTSRAGRITSD